MSESTEQPIAITSELPAEHGIEDCPKCGYCLKGAVSLVCPECGLNVIESREAQRKKESRKDSFYSILALSPIVSLLHCKLTGWPILDDPYVSALLRYVVFDLPLQMIITVVALLFLLVEFKTLGRILILFNVTLALLGIVASVVYDVLTSNT